MSQSSGLLYLFFFQNFCLLFFPLPFKLKTLSYDVFLFVLFMFYTFPNSSQILPTSLSTLLHVLSQKRDKKPKTINKNKPDKQKNSKTNKQNQNETKSPQTNKTTVCFVFAKYLYFFFWRLLSHFYPCAKLV